MVRNVGTFSEELAYLRDMALNVTTVVSVARTGSSVVRYLIRPARRLSSRQWNEDPWLASALTQQARQGASLVRRGVGVLVLVALSILASVLLLPVMLLLGLGTLAGSDISGWLLGLTLLLGFIGAIWTTQRAKRILYAEETELGRQTLQEPYPADEQHLLMALRQHERALPKTVRGNLHNTIIATRDALRASTHEQTLSRETFDVQQAARQDIPELLEVYKASPKTLQSDLELSQQLRLIENRMQRVIQTRATEQQRALKAHGKYLESKYQPEYQPEEE